MNPYTYISCQKYDRVQAGNIYPHIPISRIHNNDAENSTIWCLPISENDLKIIQKRRPTWWDESLSYKVWWTLSPPRLHGEASAHNKLWNISMLSTLTALTWQPPFPILFPVMRLKTAEAGAFAHSLLWLCKGGLVRPTFVAQWKRVAALSHWNIALSSEDHRN